MAGIGMRSGSTASVEAPGPEAETDEQLIARIRGGDEAAFQVIYERFFRRVYLFVDKRLRNPADTEETVQEVFINVFNSLDSYRGEAPFAAWVFGLTRRTIAGRFKRKRHPTVPLLDEADDTKSLQSSSPSPVEAYECQELLTQIEEKLDRRLSAEQRVLRVRRRPGVPAVVHQVDQECAASESEPVDVIDLRRLKSTEELPGVGAE